MDYELVQRRYAKTKSEVYPIHRNGCDSGRRGGWEESPDHRSSGRNDFGVCYCRPARPWAKEPQVESRPADSIGVNRADGPALTSCGEGDQMRRILWNLIVATLLIPLLAGAQTLPDGVRKGPSMVGITEYSYPNGLRVLLLPDPGSSTITINVTYLVGSRHEGYG